MDDVDNQRESNTDYMPGGITGKGFRPGVSGNPGGRPKGRSITAQLRKLIDEGMDGHDIAEALAKAGIKQALKGDHRFWQSVIERMDGKVPDKIEGAIAHTVKRVILEDASNPKDS